MNRASASPSVLHLVLHGRLRPRLSADRALLFSLSRPVHHRGNGKSIANMLFLFNFMTQGRPTVFLADKWPER
jgi:hypothetical protein